MGLLSGMSFGSDQPKTRKQRSPHEICQQILKDLLEDEDNKICADCNAKGTQWASWNLGLFLCIRCAGIHRNLGVHISKVKSIYLDTWSQENLYMLQKVGNRKAREIYEANLPKSVHKSEHDPNIESWIRMKYEIKGFVDKDCIPPKYEKEKNLSKHKKKSGKHKHKASDNLNSSIPADGKTLSSDNGVTSEAKKVEDYNCGNISNSLKSESLGNLKKIGITLNSSLWQ